MPLQHVLPDFPFSKWSLDFIGLINPSSSAGNIFFLTATDYLTKWTEVVPLRHSQDEQVVNTYFVLHCFIPYSFLLVTSNLV
jgi:hypothetical protein